MDDFKIKLRDLVIYMLPLDCKEDAEIVNSYVEKLIVSFEEYKNL